MTAASLHTLLQYVDCNDDAVHLTLAHQQIALNVLFAQQDCIVKIEQLMMIEQLQQLYSYPSRLLARLPMRLSLLCKPLVFSSTSCSTSSSLPCNLSNAFSAFSLASSSTSAMLSCMFSGSSAARPVVVCKRIIRACQQCSLM
jgi:hypothetical protein